VIPTGFALALPQDYEAQVRPRSGLALRQGLTILNAPGTIDADYREEVKVLLINLGDKPVEVKRGDRLAGKVALVTGAGAVGPGWGNGKATAVVYGREGAKVFAVDINIEAARETVGIVEEEGGEAMAWAADVTEPEAVTAVVEACIATDLPVLPGINNPTGVEQAMGFGLEAMKFFPAEASGGVPFLRALSGPYPSIRFLPTGGIGPNNLGHYLALPNVLACGGSWL